MRRISSNGVPSVADLYPELSPEELKVAQENIDRYLQLISRITTRLDDDPEALASAQAILDEEEESSRQGIDLS